MMIIQEKFARDVAFELARAKVHKKKTWSIQKIMRLLSELVKAKESAEEKSRARSYEQRRTLRQNQSFPKDKQSIRE